jgi:hypothetical protein
VKFIGGIISNYVITPILKPLLRLVGGMLAIPVFRFLLRRVFRVRTSHAELERDLEHWFRGCIVLLAATANLEDFLFGWLPWHRHEDPWLTLLLRLMLAVGVIETMPDQDVFCLVHRGPPKLDLYKKSGWMEMWSRRWEVLHGLWVLHLRRSSPVLAIMCVILGPTHSGGQNPVGWCCYGISIVQYLIIAHMVDRHRLMEDLGERLQQEHLERELTDDPESLEIPRPAASPPVSTPQD